MVFVFLAFTRNDASFCFKKATHYNVVLEGKLKAGIYTPWEPAPSEVSHMTIDRCTEHCCRNPDTDVVFLLDRWERVRELSHVHVICSVLVCLIENNVGDFCKKKYRSRWHTGGSTCLYRCRISSVCRVLDCRAGGRWFESRGRTNTAFSLQTARPSHDSDDHVNLRSRLHLET